MASSNSLPPAGTPGKGVNLKKRKPTGITLVQVTSLARTHTETAIRTLQKICTHGKNENAQVRAAEALLSRAWGGPLQASVAVKFDMRQVGDLSEEQLMAIAAGKQVRVVDAVLEAGGAKEFSEAFANLPPEPKQEVQHAEPAVQIERK